MSAEDYLPGGAPWSKRESFKQAAFQDIGLANVRILALVAERDSLRAALLKYQRAAWSAFVDRSMDSGRPTADTALRGLFCVSHGLTAAELAECERVAGEG